MTIHSSKPICLASSNSPQLIHRYHENQGNVNQLGATYETIGVLADILDDIEDVRKRTANRLRALTADPDEFVGEKGGTFGKGLPEWMPEVQLVRQQLEEIEGVEKNAIKRLENAMSALPLNTWQKNTVGIGKKQLGRLLGAIGDPADRQMVSQLWAYCGYHVIPMTKHGPTTTSASSSVVSPNQAPSENHSSLVGVAPKRKKGEQSNWSNKARMRAWNIAGSCIKQKTSPYRVTYDQARIKYAEAIHNVDCAQCKAKVGDPLSLGHQHARALRIVAKTMLKDLWVESKRLQDS